ncbi:fibronectin type III domain-containing protein, partial [Marine Group I thaumarchaeote]|nr:fibronectin type III domain-containing protein [Marine Group I thaumarchaeote]
VIFNSIIYDNEIEGYMESENYRMNLSTYNNAYGDNDALIDYSLIEFFSETGLEEDDLVDTDPGFVGNGDYSLATSSIAIGAGIDEFEGIDAPAFDYNSNSRPNPDGSDPDLGAFEHEFSTTPYPAKPQNLTVDSEGDSTVTISWTANTEDDLSKYRIYYGTSTAATLLDSVSGTPSYTATGLDNYTTYYFAVSAVDLDGYESGKSNEVTGTPKWFGPVWYVDEDNGYSQNSGDGSPTKPYKDIQDAIDKTDPLARTDGLIDTVLVLPGTYDDRDDQKLYFKYTSGTNEGQPKNLVLKSRDGAETTILDGEGNRVFEIEDGTDTTLQIIGFTITASSGGESNDDYGSVITVRGNYDWNTNSTTYTGATFRDCKITDVNADQVLIYAENSNLLFQNCEFTGNTVTYSDNNNYNDGYGGVIRIGQLHTSDGQGNIWINQSRFENNLLTTTSENISLLGGALYISRSPDYNIRLTNTIIANNENYDNSNPEGSSNSGGAINTHGGSLTIINSTIVDNILRTNSNPFMENGSGIYCQDVSNDGKPIKLTVFNSIVTGNEYITNASSNPMSSNLDQFYFNNENDGIDIYASYRLFGGNDDIGGDEILLNIDPDFANTTYVLHERSPAIGAGETVSEDVDGNEIYAPTTDITGVPNSRPMPSYSNPDLGAYEHELAVTPYPSVVEDLTATPLHRSVQLEWDYHEDEDVTSYIAYMSEDSIAFTAIDT